MKARPGAVLPAGPLSSERREIGCATQLAVQRCALSLLPHADSNEASVWLDALRLLAFLLILAAIIDKNRAR